MDSANIFIENERNEGEEETKDEACSYKAFARYIVVVANEKERERDRGEAYTDFIFLKAATTLQTPACSAPTSICFLKIEDLLFRR